MDLLGLAPDLQEALRFRRLLEQEPEQNRPIVARDLYRWLGSPDFTGVSDLDALSPAEQPRLRRSLHDIRAGPRWAFIERGSRRSAGRGGSYANRPEGISTKGGTAGTWPP